MANAFVISLLSSVEEFVPHIHWFKAESILLLLETSIIIVP